MIERDLIFLQPFRIGLARGQPLLDFLVGDDATFDRIHQKHLARLQPAFRFDLLRLDRQARPLRTPSRPDHRW